MQKIEIASLVDQTTKALIRYIESGDIGIGDKMPSEAVLCQEYGVSRTTIREALRFLQALGYVELSHNKGAFVLNKIVKTKSDAKQWMLTHAREVLDVLAVRAVLEPMAAALAAKQAKQEELYVIMGLKTLFEDVADREDHTAMNVYDEKFHASIIAASQNAFLMGINDVMAEALRNFRSRTFALDSKGRKATGAHAKIAEAIMARDPAAAEQYMREHMETNIEIMKMYLISNGRA
jgi:GntR family transcriptional repressor for pyruvate dehydrogenase complex